MMNSWTRATKVLVSSSVIGLAFSLCTWQAKAVTLNSGAFPNTQFTLVSDTPTFLDLKLVGVPFPSNAANTPQTVDPTYPPVIGRPVTKGPLIPILSGSFWNVFLQTTTFPGVRGPDFALGRIFAEQVTPAGSNLPKASFLANIAGDLNGTQSVSYLANSPSGTIFPSFIPNPDPYSPSLPGTTCALGSPNCVYYEYIAPPLADVQSLTAQGLPIPYELKGFFQPPKAVPEPSMEVGALAALAMMAFFRFKKTYQRVGD